jgi:uncharacterized protein (DUF2164 family)
MFKYQVFFKTTSTAIDNCITIIESEDELTKEELRERIENDKLSNYELTETQFDDTRYLLNEMKFKVFNEDASGSYFIDELQEAIGKHFHNRHEAYAVILQKTEDLRYQMDVIEHHIGDIWNEIKANGIELPRLTEAYKKSIGKVIDNAKLISTMLNEFQTLIKGEK